MQIADTHFRRQFLFQLLILLSHLLTFTKSAKAEWATTRNRSLHMDFTLEEDLEWVHDTINKANEELRQTAPNGRSFADTVQVILEREKTWTKWKNELCAPFDKEAWSQEVEVEDVDGQVVKRKVGLEEATKDIRTKMGEAPPQWPHTHGSSALSEIWALGYRDLSDLERKFQPGDIRDYVKKVKQEDARIEMRRNQLTKTAERIAQARAKAAAAVAAPPPPVPTSTGSTTAVAPKPVLPNPSIPPSTAAPATGLQHPLPAKPVTSPPKPPSQPEPAAVPVVVAPVVVAPPPPAPSPVPPPVVAELKPVPLPRDDQIAVYEDNKQRWNWLALRTARDQYLQHFGKIGAGDVLLLAQEIEKEKVEKEREREKVVHAEKGTPGGAQPVSGAKAGEDQAGTRDTEGDENMEG